ncbi:hypothetical protein K501DRAFT_272458 [Backusella circina FSU 941]|nr:hypothetical protein K501DRAFT_272458 [Backusella circina FSU 941]
MTLVQEIKDVLYNLDRINRKSMDLFEMNKKPGIDSRRFMQKDKPDPSVLLLTRQKVPQLKDSSIEAVRQGGCPSYPEGWKSDFGCQKWNGQGIPTHVVSMPYTEQYDEQPRSYKQPVLIPGVAVVSVEALGVHVWERYAHARVDMRLFGASAPYQVLFLRLGIGTRIKEVELLRFGLCIHMDEAESTMKKTS